MISLFFVTHLIHATSVCNIKSATQKISWIKLSFCFIVGCVFHLNHRKFHEIKLPFCFIVCCVFLLNQSEFIPEILRCTLNLEKLLLSSLQTRLREIYPSPFQCNKHLNEQILFPLFISKTVIRAMTGYWLPVINIQADKLISQGETAEWYISIRGIWLSLGIKNKQVHCHA